MTSSQNFDIENQHGLEKNDRTSDLKEQFFWGEIRARGTKHCGARLPCACGHVNHSFMAICIHMHVVMYPCGCGRAYVFTYTSCLSESLLPPFESIIYSTLPSSEGGGEWRGYE
jgi:hypothetical protein